VWLQILAKQLGNGLQAWAAVVVIEDVAVACWSSGKLPDLLECLA
jgi:hypothetical protein